MSAEQPFPTILEVEIRAPFAWLAAGWRDFRAAPGASLFYGIAFVTMGFILNALFAGLATFYIGLALTGPLVGHATWHAYRAVVAPVTSQPSPAEAGSPA